MSYTLPFKYFNRTFLHAIPLLMLPLMTVMGVRAETVLDDMLERARRTPDAISAADFTRIMQLGLESGRAADVAPSVRVLLARAVIAPTPGMRQLAADIAYQAGDMRTAANRLKQVLLEAPAGQPRSEAAAQLYSVLLDLLGAHGEAYQFWREHGMTMREAPEARRFEPVFAAMAAQRNDAEAMTRLLRTALGEVPPAAERLVYDGHITWLANALRSAQPAHYSLADDAVAIAGRIRNAPVLAGRFGLVAEHLRFRAGMAGNDPETLANACDPLLAAARRYLDAAPTEWALRETLDILAMHNAWRIRTADKQDLAMQAFDRLDRNGRNQVLRHLHGNIVAGMGRTEQWMALGEKQPDTFTLGNLPAAAWSLPAGDRSRLTRQARFLGEVANREAAAIRALAAAESLYDSATWLVANESWHLTSEMIESAIGQLMWPSIRDYPRPENQALPENYTTLFWARFGHDVISRTPLAFFNRALTRHYLEAVWRLGDGEDPDDKRPLIEAVTRVAWVLDEQSDREWIVSQLVRWQRDWANATRQAIEQAQAAHRDAETKQAESRNLDPADPEAVAAATARVAETAATLARVTDRGEGIAPVEQVLSHFVEGALHDPAAAPDAVCADLNALRQAINQGDLDSYLETARTLYARIRDARRGNPRPFADEILRALLANRLNRFDTFELQSEILADQWAQWRPGGATHPTLWQLHGIIHQGRNWHNWIRPRDQDELTRWHAAWRSAWDQLVAAGHYQPWVWDRLLDTRHDNSLDDAFSHLVEERVFLRNDAFKARWSPSWAVIQYLSMMRNHFRHLENRFPPEPYFQQIYLEIIREHGVVHREFWDYAAGAAAADAALGQFLKVDPLPDDHAGAPPGDYTRQRYFEVFDRLMERCSANTRRAAIDTLQARYGKTRFDHEALSWRFATGQRVDEPATRQIFFQALDTFLERAARHPTRPPQPALPNLEPLVAAAAELDPRQIESLETLLERCMWQTPAWRWDAFNLSSALLRILAARDEWPRLSAIAPLLVRPVNTVPGGTGWPEERRTEMFSRVMQTADQGQLAIGGAMAQVLLPLQGRHFSPAQRQGLDALIARSQVAVGSGIRIDPADRRYPVHAAQDAFLAGQRARAWDLVSHHSALIAEEYRNLGLNFLTWILRRHIEAEAFDAAESMARLLIPWVDGAPMAFDLSDRAELALAHADIALARQEYPRARAQYQRIAAMDDLQATRGQARALLRIAEVDHLTRDDDKAVGQLEELRQQPDTYLQTEANVLLARIRFAQSDFESARQSLDRVFALTPNHPEGRILEGRLFLEMRRLIEATRVRVGLAADQRILVPGKPLQVEIEDRNLSIVGRGGDIEIRVWTDAGDEETAVMLPFGDSRTHFMATLPTRLATPVPGDRVLQVRGGDTVRFDFSERFKAANDVAAGMPVQELRVMADAEIAASSGRIPTREEQERQVIENMLRSREPRETQRERDRQVLSTVRPRDQVRPGSPIHVRVIAPGMSVSPERDTVQVRAVTASGDAVAAVPLLETEPYSGVFEGSLPTAMAPPTAMASDFLEGHDPVQVISRGDLPPWTAMPDNLRPKHFTVDFNDRIDLGELRIVADVPGRRPTRMVLQTSLNGRDYTSLGWYNLPAPPAELPQPRLTLAPVLGTPVLQTIEDCRHYIDISVPARGRNRWVRERAGVDIHIQNDGRTARQTLELHDRAPNDRFLAHYAARFYLPERRTRTVRLRFSRDIERMPLIFAINGEPAGGDDPLEIRRSLARGWHRIDVYLQTTLNADVRFAIETDSDEPPYMATAPAGMFDVARQATPVAAPAEPRVVFEAVEEGGWRVDFSAADTPPARLLRLWIVDYETDAPSIRKYHLTDAAGNTLLPYPEDLLALRRNQILEVLPGDSVTISFENPNPVTPARKVVEQRMRVTFHDAEVRATFVESTVTPDGRRIPRYVPMRRFNVGDTINVFINDPDGSLTEDLDRLPFTVRSSSSEPLHLEALESEEYPGVFLGRVFTTDGEASRPDELAIEPGDDIIITYFDAENTDPGIPWERVVIVEPAGSEPPELRVYSVTTDALSENERQRAEERRRTITGEEYVPIRRAAAASRPDDAMQPVATNWIGFPVIIELTYPRIALSPESTAAVYLQTAAGRAKLPRPPPANEFDPEAPGTIRLEREPASAGTIATPRGYAAVAVRGAPDAGDALDDGRFTFVVPVRLDATPDTPLIERPQQLWDTETEQVLAVRGDDEIFVGFVYDDHDHPETRHWIVRRVRLEADAFLDVMDRRFETVMTQVHVGETVFPRIIDPVRDLTDEPDAVSLSAESAAGARAELEMRESGHYSGLFRGALTLAYGTADTPPEPGKLFVQYGDTVTLRYRRPDSDIEIVRQVTVHKGADGEVLAFSKEFKDPELAVLTQFSIAEAHFEMAKQHRELGHSDRSREAIAEGRRILDEAIRDFPRTDARVQADFLMGNLSMELAGEMADGDEAKRSHFLDAIARFTEVVALYSESAYAPRAQFRKALALEQLGEIDAAAEEYVKLSYRYPDHELVAETIARLGQYFLAKGREFEQQAEAEADPVEAERLRRQRVRMFITAAQVFGRLGGRFPDHRLAGPTQLLSGQCYMRAGNHEQAVTVFATLVDAKTSAPETMSEAMYWCADSYMALNNHREAYRMFKRLTWDYPESNWARFARGRLTDSSLVKFDKE